MTDTNIRRLTIAERATAAAKRTAETGAVETNPYWQEIDGGDYLEWRIAYERALVALTADADGGA